MTEKKVRSGVIAPRKLVNNFNFGYLYILYLLLYVCLGYS